MPPWLVALSWTSLAAGVISCAIVIAHLAFREPQKMWVMNIVWPITALYAGPLGLWAYWAIGRLSSRERFRVAREQDREPPSRKKPFWQAALVGTTHCGSGCCLADILGEGLLLVVPFVLFGRRMFASWLVDFILALLFGIAFQYFTIKPMRNLSPGKGLVEAAKADTLSLTAWQAGMYGWMAVAAFLIFRRELDPAGPLFWFMMQVAMVMGFLTSYPVNRWLLRRGIKESM